MSLILEALRKSEAERRRGQVPGLHAEMPPAARPARPRPAHWPWLASIAVITIVAATWLLRDKWVPTPPADEPAPASTEPAAATEVDRVVADTARADVASVAASAPATTAPPPASPDPVTVSRQSPEPASTTTPDLDPALGREPVPATAESSDPLPPPRPTTPVTTPAITPAADATTTAVDDSEPMRLSDLAAAERRALPPLQVSMHMWAPTSARRFAIVDGARVNEGDRLGDAVVDEITRDGVVLAWRGRRVHIPIH